MIRGNYSLAAEFRKNEQKQQSKIQKRQKHQHKLEKLSSVDPIRLYKQIKSLENNDTRSVSESKRLDSLKDDWKFIEKNKLHQENINSFLKTLEKEEARRLESSKKLWGRQSVYFNPELNPLGKVPNYQNLEGFSKPLPNYTMPIKNRKVYERDPLIDALGVTLPPGDQPRFYKQAQNTETRVSGDIQAKSEVQEEKGLTDDKFHVDLVSDLSYSLDSDHSTKRQKRNKQE